MTIVLVLLLAMTLAGLAVYAIFGSNSFGIFSLVEHKKVPDRIADLLPWAALVAPNVVFNKNGSFMTAFRYRGPDLASATKHELISACARLNNSLRRLQGGWAIYAIDERNEAEPYKVDEFPAAIAQLLDIERAHMFKGVAHHENTYHFVLVYLPPPDVSGSVAQWFYEGDDKTLKNHESHLKNFQRDAARIANLLTATLPQLVRLEDGELLTFLHDSVSLKRQKIGLPEVPMYLDAFLPDMPLTGGLDPKLGDYWIQAMTIVGFPQNSSPGLLDGLNRLPFEYRWVTRFIFLDHTDAEKQIKTYQQRWLSLRKSLVTVFREALFGHESAMENTDAANKAVDANIAQQELGSGAVAFGHFTQTILLYDKDREALIEKRLQIEKVIDGLSFTTIDENRNHNALDAFLGAIPGNCANNVRHPLVNTINLVHLFPLSAVWAGDREDANLNGPPLLQVVTDSNTPFRLGTVYGDVGHALIVGPTGTGKSTLLRALESAWLRYEGAQVFIFDMKKGAKVLTHAVGGEFYDLGEDSCELALQPLADVDDFYERTWAAEWIETICMQENVPINPNRKADILKALKALGDGEREHRTLTAFKIKVQDPTVKAAIATFTHEGSYGRLLDSDHDNLGTSRWQAFEMRELTKNMKGAVMPTLTYLFHRLERRFKASTPTLLVLDEGWLFLDNPVFAPRLNEWLRTLRSYKVYVVFASQSPSSVAESPLFYVINESCYTKIFLAFGRAQEESNAKFYRRFGLNERQIEIIGRAVPKREYYFTSPLGNRLFSLPLGEIGLAYCAATGEADVAMAEPFFQLPTDQFNRAYLKARGLEWAAEMLPPQTDQTPFCHQETSEPKRAVA
jgi:type IV secretion/conjugal transfer VirB4 family ATPase